MAENRTKKKALVAASIAGLIAAASFASVAPVQAATGELESCGGINACKGMGACGGKGNSCAGKNACKGQGWIEVKKGECAKIQGGVLQA